MGMILVNKMHWKSKFSKNVDNKKMPQNLYSSKKKREILGWFLTLKIDFEIQKSALFDCLI